MYNFSLFANRLRNCIDESGCTQVELADRLGISKFTLSKYLNGRIPETTILYALSKFFGKSMEWFLTGEESKNCTNVQQKVEAIYDPDLMRMIDVLTELMQSENQNLRGWAIIQFENAFKEHCAALDEKKLHA